MIKLYFLSLFSKKARIQFGRKIWKKLDEQLPLAVGVLVNDASRMEQFSKLLDNLGTTKKKALQEWLLFETHDLTYGFPDFCTGSEEEYQRKWLQIYNTHLDVLKKKLH